MIALVIVMAVVLVLVAKAWKSVAPEALEASGALPSSPVNDHGQSEAAGALRSGELPRLHETRQETDDHHAQVQQALDATE
jgi:hypothetical protein